MKLGIFGGTFNPVHYGHLRAAEDAAELLGLDNVLFLPAGSPPLKTSQLADSSHRLAMVKRAVQSNARFRVLDLECRAKEKSYTVRTLEALQGRYPKAELCFLLGIDAFLDIPRWWQPLKLLGLADFGILSRPGWKFSALADSPYLQADSGGLVQAGRLSGRVVTVPLVSRRKAHLLPVTPLPISSTDIRCRVAEGRSIKYLLPPEVESYIISRKLYEFSG